MKVESPLYETLEVAREYGIRPFRAECWDDLTPDQQAYLIAHRRIRQHAEAVLAHKQVTNNVSRT